MGSETTPDSNIYGRRLIMSDDIDPCYLTDLRISGRDAGTIIERLDEIIALLREQMSKPAKSGVCGPFLGDGGVVFERRDQEGNGE